MSDGSEAPDQQALTWDYTIPLAPNPFLWWDFLRVLGASLLIMELLVFLMSPILDDPLWIPLGVLGLVAAILAALFLIVTLLLYGNRYHARFAVNARGARMEDAGQGRWFKWRMVILGLLARHPGVVMSALAGSSGYGETASWRDVRRVTVHRRLRVVTLSNSWRSMLRLYCPPDLFDPVVQSAQTYVALAVRHRAARVSRPSMPECPEPGPSPQVPAWPGGCSPPSAAKLGPRKPPPHTPAPAACPAGGPDSNSKSRQRSGVRGWNVHAGAYLLMFAPFCDIAYRFFRTEAASGLHVLVRYK